MVSICLSFAKGRVNFKKNYSQRNSFEPVVSVVQVTPHHDSYEYSFSLRLVTEIFVNFFSVDIPSGDAYAVGR
jgi:hypothetical protein